ncbi:MAG: hypothetical protein AAFN16_00570 [Pseudomonadota bacterium]
MPSVLARYIITLLNAVFFVVEEPQIIIEEKDEPDSVVNLSQSPDLACEHLAQIDFPLSDTDPAASRNAHSAVVE